MLSDADITFCLLFLGFSTLTRTSGPEGRIVDIVGCRFGGSKQGRGACVSGTVALSRFLLPAPADLGGADCSEGPLDGVPHHSHMARLHLFVGDRMAARDPAALRAATAGQRGVRRLA